MSITSCRRHALLLTFSSCVGKDGSRVASSVKATAHWFSLIRSADGVSVNRPARSSGRTACPVDTVRHTSSQT